MKNFKTLLFSLLLLGIATHTTKAATAPADANINRYDGNAYIFVEGGVEFSVFQDGQFDFIYLGPQQGSEVIISTPNVDMSFNSGYDYEAFVQYDAYGAVVQVEQVPIFYDEFGRIVQAGTVDISYRNRRLVRVGGLNIHYNNFGHFGYATGFINPFNRFYVFRPWHVFYVSPIFASCVVWDNPYRRYYTPFRYSYYSHVEFYNNRNIRPYNNGRRYFHRPGSRVHYRDGRTTVNRNFNPDRRNTMVSNHGRSDRALARVNNSQRTEANNRSRVSNANSPRNLSKGNSRTTNARGIAKTNSNTRGIAKNTRTTPEVSKGTINNNRGIAKNRTTSSRSVATTKKSNSRGNSRGIDVNNRPSSRKGTTASSRTPKRQSKARVASKTRSQSAFKNTRGSSKQAAKRTSNTKSSKGAATRKSSSRSKSSKANRGGSSKSTSRRGSGL